MCFRSTSSCPCDPCLSFARGVASVLFDQQVCLVIWIIWVPPGVPFFCSGLPLKFFLNGVPAGAQPAVRVLTEQRLHARMQNTYTHFHNPINHTKNRSVTVVNRKGPKVKVLSTLFHFHYFTLFAVYISRFNPHKPQNKPHFIQFG